MMREKSSRSSCRNRVSGLPMPALLNMMSRPPKRSTAKSTSACTWSMSLTSVCLKAAASPMLVGDLLPTIGVDVRHHDACALCGEERSGRPTDAARATRHDGDLSHEFLRLHAATLRFRSFLRIRARPGSVSPA